MGDEAMTENPYLPGDHIARGAWGEGFAAGRASRDAEALAVQQRSDDAHYRWVGGVEYLGSLLREQGKELAVLRAQLAEKESECERLRAEVGAHCSGWDCPECAEEALAPASKGDSDG
jgi:hypothetical protein